MSDSAATTPYSGLSATGVVLLVKTTSLLGLFAGSPVGVVAGQAGTPVQPPDQIWDYVNKVFYICTVTGNATTTVWSSFVGSPQTVVIPQAPDELLGGTSTPGIATAIGIGPGLSLDNNVLSATIAAVTAEYIAGLNFGAVLPTANPGGGRPWLNGGVWQCGP